jgi:hypothetical protein
MQVKYSKHLKIRLEIRKIDYDLPQQIFEKAGERFMDTLTGHSIAVAKAVIYDKERDVMVAYKHEEVDVKLLTIHPLKDGETDKRIKSGRWRRL